MQEVPLELLTIQKWFASIITRPIDHNSQMMEISPSGVPMSLEAAQFISPNARLRSDKRIEIYNQQYWWRLLSILHQNFPGLTRLFGYVGFNHVLAIPFLNQYPSTNWSLVKLGKLLPLWIEQRYKEADLDLVLNMARLDWAYHELFFVSTPQYCEIELHDKLTLQPHVRLFDLPFNLLSFREEFMKKDVEHWVENKFPNLDKRECKFILYRHKKEIKYREITNPEWKLLESICQGLSIEQACDLLEEENGEVVEEAEKNIQMWIQEWVRDQLLRRA